MLFKKGNYGFSLVMPNSDTRENLSAGKEKTNKR